MLIDIFAHRYEQQPLFKSFEQRDNRLLRQAFCILSEDIYPYYRNGSEDRPNVAAWASLHDKIARELGTKELSPHWFSYTSHFQGTAQRVPHKHTMVTVCENWITSPISGCIDEHIKQRLSLIELGFRTREMEIDARNNSAVTDGERLVASLNDINSRLKNEPTMGVVKARKAQTEAFQTSVDELNARFRQAKYPLNYHNGFIQIAADQLVQQQIETPFWELVKGPLWKNVDLDMKDALDLRDNDGRDPAFFCRSRFRKYNKNNFGPKRVDARRRKRCAQLH